MRSVLLRIIATAFAVVSGAEFAARQFGLVDFPIYDVDNRIGYIPAANQRGIFMGKNDWVFNERNMGTPKPFAAGNDDNDILLIGDSIVFGGNTYRQSEKLGPQLETATGTTVWPISAGSWSLQNELQWLRDNPDVVRSVSQIVFVLNSADFGEPTSWSSELTHPRQRPVLALWYLAEKYALQVRRDISDDLRVPTRDINEDLRAFAKAWGRPFDVWLYPDKSQMLDSAKWASEMEPHAMRLVGLGITNMQIFRGNELLAFTAADYRDSIHPTPEATTRLANAIASSTPR